MATYIALVNFTDQGMRTLRGSPDRLAAFRQMAAQQGVTVRAVYYTVGVCDMVAIVEGSDEAVASVAAEVGALGNVRGQTLLAYSAEEMRGIFANMP